MRSPITKNVAYGPKKRYLLRPLTTNFGGLEWRFLRKAGEQGGLAAGLVNLPQLRAAEDEARMDAANRFLQFITTAEAGTLWVNEVGELPAQTSAVNDPALLEDPFIGPFVAGLNYSHATFFVDETAQRQVMIDALDLVRLSGMDPCDALQEAAAIEQDLLDDFWEDR